MRRIAVVAEPDWWGRAGCVVPGDVPCVVTASKFAISALREYTATVECIRPVGDSGLVIPNATTRILYPGNLSGEKVHRAYSALDAFVNMKCSDRLQRDYAACAFIALTGFEKTLEPAEAVFVPSTSPSCAYRLVTELTERTARAFGIPVIRV